MAIQLATTRQTVSNAYVALGNWIGLATGSPGTTTTPANEVSGGSPAYARKQLSAWTPGSGGVNTGSSVTIDVPACTVTHILLASASTVAAANMIDWSDVTDIVFSAQGSAVVTPTFTIT